MKLRTFKDEAMTQSNLDDVDHDRMAAHALMQAMENIPRKYREWSEIRASELMRKWGFDSTPEQPE